MEVIAGWDTYKRGDWCPDLFLVVEGCLCLLLCCVDRSETNPAAHKLSNSNEIRNSRATPIRS